MSGLVSIINGLNAVFLEAAIPAGFAGAFTESIMNQVEAFDKGVKDFNLTTVFDVGFETLSKGIKYAITGTISSLLFHLDPGVKSVDFLTQGSTSKCIWYGTANQNTLVSIGSIGYNIGKNSPGLGNTGTTLTSLKPGVKRTTLPLQMVA